MKSLNDFMQKHFAWILLVLMAIGAVSFLSGCGQSGHGLVVYEDKVRGVACYRHGMNGLSCVVVPRRCPNGSDLPDREEAPRPFHKPEDQR